MNKILVTGGSGLIGNSFKKILKDAYFPSKNELNLLNKEEVYKYFKKNNFDTIFHIAAKVGGVKANTNYVADFYSENIIINTNVIDVAASLRIPNLICCLSTCVYPEGDKITYPLTENQLHNGEPHKSNFGYAYAKRMVDIQLRAIRQQHKLNYISAIPNNLYGENDNFDLENGHVIPALIRKIWEAKINNKSTVEVWGDGTPLREFTYSHDIAKIFIFLIKNYKDLEPINVGNTEEYSIKEVVEILCRELEYDGKIIWDVSKPNGQFKKPSSNKKLIDLGWEESNYTSLKEGLKKTCEWFKINYPNVRGI